jgi:CBS domain-containing protein
MTSDVLEFGVDLPIAEAQAALEDPTDDHAGWRQQLYPVVDQQGRMIGIVTRGMLLGATGDETLLELALTDPVTTHGDQPLRHVAELMAIHDVTTLPVMDRDEPDRTIGVVSLPQLLTARQRDQQEARERERVLQVRLVRPRATES